MEIKLKLEPAGSKSREDSANFRINLEDPNGKKEAVTVGYLRVNKQGGLTLQQNGVNRMLFVNMLGGSNDDCVNAFYHDVAD